MHPTFLIHSPVQIKLPRSNPYENLRLHGRRKSTTSGSLWLDARVTGHSWGQLMLSLAVTTALTNAIDATFEKLDWMTQIVFNFRFCSSLLIQSTSTESPQGPIDPVHWLPVPAAKEWYDVKGAMRSVTVSDTNPSPFKPDIHSPFRNLLMGECTRYIRIDPAHTFAIDGIGKDFYGSTIVMLVRMGHFGGGAVALSLQNAYARFMAFCNAYKKHTSIVDFSFSTLKLPNNSFLNSSIWNLTFFFWTAKISTPANPPRLI